MYSHRLAPVPDTQEVRRFRCISARPLAYIPFFLPGSRRHRFILLPYHSDLLVGTTRVYQLVTLQLRLGLEGIAMLVLNLSRSPKFSLCPSFSFSLTSPPPKSDFNPVTRCQQLLRSGSPSPLCSSSGVI